MFSSESPQLFTRNMRAFRGKARGFCSLRCVLGGKSCVLFPDEVRGRGEKARLGGTACRAGKKKTEGRNLSVYANLKLNVRWNNGYKYTTFRKQCQVFRGFFLWVWHFHLGLFLSSARNSPPSKKEEYPKGEVVGRKRIPWKNVFSALCSLPPRPLGTPPPRRRGIKLLLKLKSGGSYRQAPSSTSLTTSTFFVCPSIRKRLSVRSPTSQAISSPAHSSHCCSLRRRENLRSVR